MSHINQPYTVYSKLVGVGVVSALMLIGCNKKDKPKEATAPAEPQTTQSEPTEPTVDLIACDDPVALVTLTQSIRGSVMQQVHRQMRDVAERSNTPIDMNKVDTVVNSILVDVASPAPLQDANASEPQNASGMQTCRANLSLTVPSEDIYRASNLYAQLDGGTLLQRIQSQNLSLNNNMIVDSTFNYVVGTQDGQTIARVIGQPAITNMVGDLMAKSQLKVAVDEHRRTLRAAEQRRQQQAARERARQQTQRPPAQSGANSSSNQNPFSNNASGSNADNASRSNSGNSNLDLPTLDSNGQLQGQSSISSHRGVVDPNAPKSGSSNLNSSKPSEATITEAPSRNSASTTNSDSSEFSVPKDDTIEMVITEEEGGY